MTQASTTDILPLCAWCGDEIWDQTPQVELSGTGYPPEEVPIHGACRHPWRKRGCPNIADGTFPGRGEA